MAKKKDVVAEEVIQDTNVEQVAEETVAEQPVVEEPVKKPTTVTGYVTECARLYVRKKPDVKADPVCIVNLNDALTVDEAKSKGDWYRVTTADNKYGYCMKKYVNIVR